MDCCASRPTKGETRLGGERSFLAAGSPPPSLGHEPSKGHLAVEALYDRQVDENVSGSHERAGPCYDSRARISRGQSTSLFLQRRNDLAS